MNYWDDTKGDYYEDRKFADLWMPKAREIIGSVVVKVASSQVDIHQATDCTVYTIQSGPRAGQAAHAIAIRVRRPYNFWCRSSKEVPYWAEEFTVRSSRDTGAITELSKIKKGFTDLGFYGHVEQNELRHWIVFDMEIFRQYESQAKWQSINNGDGTHGKAYEISSFPAILIIEASPTMKDVLAKGVHSVKPKAHFNPSGTLALEYRQWCHCVEHHNNNKTKLPWHTPKIHDITHTKIGQEILRSQ